MTLNQCDIHVWQFDVRDRQWDAFSKVLSRDEREKAGRFRFARLRENSSRSRITLRLVLSRYLNLAADKIRFNYSDSGKPEIPGTPLFFNVSHSGDVAFIAIALHPIGVDVESIADTKLDMADVIETVCHVTERAVLEGLSPADGRGLFYQLWTRKEAFCKAVGVGLQYPFAELYFKGPCAPSVNQVCDGRYGSLPFYTHDLTCPVGYAASICAPLCQASIQLLGSSLVRDNSGENPTRVGKFV